MGDRTIHIISLMYLLIFKKELEIFSIILYNILSERISLKKIIKIESHFNPQIIRLTPHGTN